MAVSWETIQEEFQVFGAAFADDILPSRCVQVCEKYAMNASDLCDEWIAWSRGNSAVVDFDSFEKMAQDIEKRRQKDVASQQNITAGSGPGGPLTPKLHAHNKRVLAQSPLVGTPKRQAKEGSTVTALSASFTDGTDSSPARVYKSGKRSGNVVVAYKGSAFKDGKKAEKIEVNVLTDMVINGRLQTKNRTDLNIAVLERLAKVKEAYPLGPDMQLKDISGGFLEPGDLVYGMLRPPRKPNLPFLLYGDYETSRSSSLHVVPKFPAFPGQIVMAKVGNSVSDGNFLESPIAPQLPPLAAKPQCRDRIRVVAAAGPYTTIDTLSYEPYHDFVDKIARDEPDLAIMFGPFVDRNHKKLSVNLDCTFQAYFTQLLQHLSKKLTGKRTRVFVVANYRENHTTGRAFPTEKYSLTLPNVTPLNDPTVLSVNGVHVALSSTDVFRALNDAMVNVEENSDLFRLAARTLLEQRSFYPVFPPHGDLIVRTALANRTMMESRPHLFITPATVAPFVVPEEGCLFVNPGSLVKGMDAGSYAVIDIGPTEGRESIVDTSKVSVVKI